MAPFGFVLESQPFQLFARPQGDIDKTLMRLPKKTTAQIVEAYKTDFGIDPDAYDIIQKDALEQVVTEWKTFVKAQKPNLNTFLGKISKMMTNYS